MKNILITLILFFFSIIAYAQDTKYEYAGRTNPATSKEKIKDAVYISDISPELWKKMGMPFKERQRLEELRREKYSLGIYLYPQGGYDMFLETISIEVSADADGKTKAAKSTGDILTQEQKNIFNAAALGADVYVSVRFKYKGNVFASSSDEIVDGKTAVTIVPETEAEYPGGYKQLSVYLKENIMDKVPAKGSDKIRQATVKFTIGEGGEVMDVKLTILSADAKTDQLILDAFNKMSKWKPAKNAKGITVKQQFTIPFGNEGC